MEKIILDLCGGTGAWSLPYKESGYDVRLITIPEFDVTDEKVVQMCISLKPYGILCATPCEMWGRMGNIRWKERTRDDIMRHADILIKNLRIIYESNPVFWCIENPPGRLRQFLGEPVFRFDAYDFGEPYHKKTCLWGKFHNPKIPILEQRPEPIKDYIRWYGNSKKNSRGVTPYTFAKAFYDANP